MTARRFTASNAVPGCPGWYFGLLVRSHRPPPLDHLPVVTFSVFKVGGRQIAGLRASGYRTTALARRMGERELRGYEYVAREAIRISANQEQT